MKNLAQRQVLGTIEEFQDTEKKRREKARLSVQKVPARRRQTMAAIPVIVHTGEANSDGANSSMHGLYSFGKLPVLSRNTITNNALPKPKAVVSGQN